MTEAFAKDDDVRRTTSIVLGVGATLACAPFAGVYALGCGLAATLVTSSIDFGGYAKELQNFVADLQSDFNSGLGNIHLYGVNHVTCGYCDDPRWVLTTDTGRTYQLSEFTYNLVSDVLYGAAGTTSWLWVTTALKP
ncbi:MAG: hypothetical protein HYZ49_12100 [Chloroflexi bacterium]|nr:hypothetical protein [Chloroflexota bacterium]